MSTSNESAVISGVLPDAVDVPNPSPSADALARVPVAAPSTSKKRTRTPKPPKDSKIYKVAMAVVALRAQGLQGQDVADQLGIPYNTMKTYLRRAVDRGWLTMGNFSSAEDKVELVLVDKAIRNASEMLDNRDKDMTIETLKGTGVFKQHQAVKVDNSTNIGLALKVQVEFPPLPNGVLQTVHPGSIGGARAAEIPIDAEVIEDIHG